MKYIIPVILILFVHLPATATTDVDLDKALDRFIAQTKACPDTDADDYNECLESFKLEEDKKLEEFSDMIQEGMKVKTIKEGSTITIPNDFDYTYPLSDELFYDKVFDLDWKISETETITHISANAEIPTIYYDEYYLDNKMDILQYLYWAEGILFDVNNYEVYQEFDFATLMYQHFNNEGYVKLDDWEDINLDDFIEEKRELIFAANAKRSKLGLDTVKSVEWLLEPELDNVNNMVHYVFTLEWWSGERSNNGTSLILGRNGYTEVDSIYTDDINIKESIEIVKTNLSDYKFNKEHQYTDFKSGDKIAAVGIAALVATSFGVKGAAQAAAAGKGLLKFGWLLLAPFLFLGRLFRKK